MKKIVAVVFCALSIVLLVTVIQKSGIVQDAGTQLAQVSYSPIPQTSPINPIAYFRFDGADTNGSSIGSKQLSLSTSADSLPNFIVTPGGPVGKFARLPHENAAQIIYLTGGTGFTNEFSIEFMMKPQRGFVTTEFFRTDDAAIDIRFNVSPSRGSTLTSSNYIQFKTITGGTSNDFRVDMNGANQRSWSNLADGNWHHFVFTRKANGTKEIWVDGTLPAGFSTSGPSGTLPSTTATSPAFFNTSTQYRKITADLDEIAFYTSSLPGNLIKQHHSDMIGGLPYQNWTPVSSVVQGSSTTGSIDPFDYAPGASLDMNLDYTTGITDKPLVQLQKYALPRYKAGHTLRPNILWSDLQYQAQMSANTITDNATVASNAANIMYELAKNFGHAITINNVTPGNDFNSLSNHRGALAKLANDNPNIPLAVLTYRTQINPKLKSQTLPNNHYLQNSNGQFINVDQQGNVITVSSGNKLWRPASTSLISSYVSDGDYIKTGIQNLINAMPARFAAKPTKVIDLINDNGEIIYGWSSTLLNTDPLVVSEAAQAGISVQKYMARKYSENVNQAFSGRFMTLNGLQNSVYTEYPHEGGPSGRMDWSEVRNVNGTIDGQKYATGDFYPRYTANWKQWTGAWHGFGWFNEAIKNQRASGDKFSSIFISAGWDPNAVSTTNVTPGHYLGLVKNLANMGSEFFYTGYFNNTGDYKNSAGVNIIGVPETYTWQNTTAAYTQALISRVDSFYKTSDLMQGDAPIHPDNLGTLGYGFTWLTNDPNVLVTVRKANSGNKYLISTNINQSTIYTGNIANEKNVTIKLDGSDITFKTRRQGSMYYFDNTNTSSPVFYQLDAWHESTHPSYWSKNFLFDAEMYDTGTATIKTTGYVGRDFTQADSYVNANGTLGYTFQPRAGSGTTFYLWARAKTTGGSATLQANVDGGSPLSTTFNSGAFQWVKLPGNFSGVTLSTNHTLNLVVPAGLDLDKFYLTPDAGFVPPVTSTDTTAPSSPTNLASPTQTSNSIDLTWTASTDNVGVVGYDVYSNSTIIASSSSNAMTLTNLTPSTMYTLSVKARDAANNVSNASVSIQVSTLASVDTQAPSVPTGLAVSGVTHNAYTVSWTASTDNVGVAGYQVKINGVENPTILTSTTYSATGLNPMTLYGVQVRAKDAVGNWSSYSSVLNVTTLQAPDTINPTGTITSPSPSTTISGTTPIIVSASDNVALDHIDFYRTTNTQIGSAVASGVSGSFTYQWNTTTVTNNSYGIYAKVYDTSGNVVTTSTVTVTVNNVVVPPIDNIDPVVSITTPTQNQTVSGTIAINATATDNVGVTKVEFYRGTTLIDTDTTANPYEVPLNTTVLANGTYTLSAKAFDAAGNSKESSVVTITVNNIPVDSVDPVVTIGSPASGATVTGATVNLVANATDNVGVTNVTFYKSDNTLLGTGTSIGSNNFSFTWNSTSTPNGSFTFYAKAYDAAGNFSQSANRSVNVNNVDTIWPSTVTGLVVTNITNTTVTLSWNPSTDNVALMGYDVWKDSNTGANRYVTGAPGTSYTISGLTPNTTYNFGVQARDTSNNTSQPPTTVIVTTASTDTTSPVVAIVSPVSSTKFTKGTVATFTANATDNVGVTKVQFWLSKNSGETPTSTPVLVCEDTSAPFTCDYTVPQTLLNPYYSFKAKAFDSANNKADSAWVWIRAKN